MEKAKRRWMLCLKVPLMRLLPGSSVGCCPRVGRCLRRPLQVAKTASCALQHWRPLVGASCKRQ